MQRTKVLILALALLSLKGFSQDETRRISAENGINRPSRIHDDSLMRPIKPGSVKIHRDARIARVDSLKAMNPAKRDGYRVQVFFGDREEAQNTRGNFVKAFPNTPAYISYLAPNFRVRVGDFRTRLEAEKFKKNLPEEYRSSYIVKDKIELPPLYSENND